MLFGQPVTSMLVFWLSVAPFCARNCTGIRSGWAHRLPFAPKAEYLPSGRVSSKLLKGLSGTVLKVVLVTPALLMNVVPTSRS